MHKINIIARSLFSLLWIFIYMFIDNNTRDDNPWYCLINCVIFADIITWLIFIPKFWKESSNNIYISGIMNIVVVIVVLLNIDNVIPKTTEWEAISVMAFMFMFGLKAGYYVLMELHEEDMRRANWFKSEDIK